MQTRLLDIFRNAGDDNVGQTLIRLAHAAEQQHRCAATNIDRQGPARNGRDRDAQFSSERAIDAAGAVRTEVDS